MEIWKVIPDLETFSASSLGRIRNDKTGNILNPSLNGGYPVVHINKDRVSKVMKVHRLVCIAFHPNPEQHSSVDHIDQNRLNNNVENLRWADHIVQSQNRRKHTKSKNGRKVAQIDVKSNTVICVYDSLEAAAKATKAEKANICNTCRGTLKTTAGFGWKYVDDMHEDVEEEWRNYPFLTELETSWSYLQISTKGRVRISNDGSHWRVLNNATDNSGYSRTYFAKNRSIATHILVANTYLGKPVNTVMVVNHKDHNRKNNDISNLEWVTRTENNIHSFYSLESKRTDMVQIQQIDGPNVVKVWATVSQAAQFFKVDHSSIHKILDTDYKCKGFHWKRVILEMEDIS